MWYNGSMKTIFWFLLILIVLIALALVFVFFVLLWPDRFIFQPSFGQNVTTLAMMLTALATLILASAAFKNIHDTNEQAKRDRKESILNEIKDWIFSIKDITLEPVTEENLTFRQFNIELRYGVPMNRVELLEIEIEKILKDQDLKEKVSKVAKLLATVMVLDRARDQSGKISENVIEAFPGYVNSVKEILSVIADEAQKEDKVKEAVDDMWKNYIKELNNAEAKVLEKIVSLKSDLLNP